METKEQTLTDEEAAELRQLQTRVKSIVKKMYKTRTAVNRREVALYLEGLALALVDRLKKINTLNGYKKK